MKTLFIIIILSICLSLLYIVGKMNEEDYAKCIEAGYGEEKCLEIYL